MAFPRLLHSLALGGLAAAALLAVGCGGKGASAPPKTDGSAPPMTDGSTLTVSFPETLPAFLAFQDGNGAWAAATPSASMSFQVKDAAGRYGLAYATTSPGKRSIIIRQYTLAEHPHVTSLPNGATLPIIKLHGTFTGLGYYGIGIMVGGQYTDANGGTSDFCFNTAAGTLDRVRATLDLFGTTTSLKVYPPATYLQDTDLGVISTTDGVPVVNLPVTVTGLTSSPDSDVYTGLSTDGGTWFRTGRDRSTAVPAWSGALPLAPSGVAGTRGYRCVAGEEYGANGTYRQRLNFLPSEGAAGPQSLPMPPFLSGQPTVSQGRLQGSWSPVSGATHIGGSGSQTTSGNRLFVGWTLSQGWLAGSPSRTSYLSPDLGALLPAGFGGTFATGASVALDLHALGMNYDWEDGNLIVQAGDFQWYTEVVPVSTRAAGIPRERVRPAGRAGRGPRTAADPGE